MIKTIEFNGQEYPLFQAEGFASKFAFPFALEVCKGVGLDIGCTKKEWALPGAIPIDKIFNDNCDAMNLPDMVVDYIFSSHCLEHLDNWVESLDYWTTRIKKGGVLFLYLPHRSQKYWLPFNNKKHIHYFDQEILREYIESSGKYRNIFISGTDLNNSFIVIGERL